MADMKDYRSKLLKDPAYALEAAKGDFIMDVTEAICEILEREGITRQELAKRMGKTRGYISQLLDGSRNMTLNTLAEIAHVLNYTPGFKLEKKEKEELGEGPFEFDRR